MKRALYLALIYLASLVLGSFIFATLFMFSCNLTMFISGLPASFFSLHFFMNGIFMSVPLVCIIVHILLVLYLIRHPKNQIISLVLYTIFGLVSWFVLIPTDLNLISRYESDIISTRIEGSSAGIFRTEDTGVFYYSKINEDGTADGLFFDTTGYLLQGESVVPLFDEKIKNESAYPYSDILIKNALQPSQFIIYPLSVYNAVLTAASFSISLGIWAWISFATMGIALLSIYGIQFASSWKLSNVIFVVCAAIFILLVNYFYYMNLYPDILKEAATKLSRLIDFKDPLIAIINLIISVVFVGFGIFMGIYRLKGSSILENEE